MNSGNVQLLIPLFEFNSQTGDSVISKIRSFGRLQPGWHYGQGVPPSGETIRTALHAHSLLMSMGFPDTDASPGIDGEILLTAYIETDDIEILIDSECLMTVTHGKDGRIMNEISEIQDLEASLKKLVGEIWRPSDLFMCYTTIENENASIALPSRIHLMGLEFQSSNVLASKAEEFQSANTLENSTGALQLSHLYSGYSTQNYYREVTA